MSNPKHLLTLLCLLAPLLQARAQPVFSMDPVWFPGSDTSRAELELELMVQRASLNWQPAEEGRQGGYTATLTLVQGGRVLCDTTWSRTDWQAADEAPDPAEKIPDQVRLSLAPTGGRLRLVVADRFGGAAVEKNMRLGPPAWLQAGVDTARTYMSEVCLGVAVPQAATEGPFLRGGLRFIPYADGLYGSGLDMLHGLFEVHGPLPTDSLELAVALLGERKSRLESRLPRPMASYTHSPEPAAGQARVLAFDYPVGHLPTGSYQIQLELKRGNETVARALRPFWVRNPDVEAPREVLGDEFEQAGVEELASQWETAQVLADHYELDAWERLDLEGRRRFLRGFWQQRDPDPSTLVNEAQVALTSRLDEARSRFPDTGRRGSISDRARVFIRYGPPDAIETDFSTLNSRFNFEVATSGGNNSSSIGSGHRDFELWTYQRIEGGVDFIFIDVQGFGTFDMVHSTKSGEYFDPQWARKLFP